MGVLLFSISLDNPSGQYSPGQAVTGKLLLNIADEETCKEVSIHFFGEGHTQWMETETHRHNHNRHGINESHKSGIGIGNDRRNSRHTYHYSAHENYFDLYTRVYGDGTNTINITPGQNVFPFTFQVPFRPLPISCSFPNGWVQYGLEARIRKPWFKVDPKTDVLPITILPLVDLNTVPGAGSPMQNIDSKQFGRCCCKTKPCIIKSFTPKLGFCPGEIIPLTVEVENNSNRQIYNLTAALVQVWTMMAKGHRGLQTRHLPVELQMAVGSGLAPGESIRWEVPGLGIPYSAEPTPNPNASEIIKMEYMINVSVSTDGSCCCRAHFGTSHPIIVGNVPLLVPVDVEYVNETTREKDRMFN